MNLETKKVLLVLFLATVAVFLLRQVYFAAKLKKIFPTTAAEQDQRIAEFNSQFTKQLLEKETIDGEAVFSGRAQRPLAVIIENHVESRPQSGVADARLVYEALAEGGITRFLAVFQNSGTKSIGPVRSTRTYFNDWAQELKAVLVHVGGNSDALYYLRKGVPGVADADQYYNGEYISRISGRYPPHNTYTSIDRLDKLVAAQQFENSPDFTRYLFKDQQQPLAVKINSISVQFSEAAYNVLWKYDPLSNSYIRYQQGAKVMDASNGRVITAKNVIIQRVENWPVQSDTPDAISMGTRRGGAAEVFLDGGGISGVWKFENERTKFYDQNGFEIKLNRGPIWIEILPPGNKVSVSK